MKKTLVVWCILGIILPSYGGIIVVSLFGFPIKQPGFHGKTMERTSFHRLFLDCCGFSGFPHGSGSMELDPLYLPCMRGWLENVSVQCR